ncbi:ubiquitin carboxyl-terminal hydrolase 25-like [Diospyros lotus]|uniref:ubiquitin carboxyl-terminal hydrolase 25-like n=1 Tax=Diospyros lotus TaxID=55363 RepID=UPI00225745DA|nr:ubiquitin carboxyl-terminal hydrolase 25-like [Diospyros lotus]XP_052178236.1 ubiquitin carboxyl-terminal hydrolase 25-like [Diospyros lotus]
MALQMTWQPTLRRHNQKQRKQGSPPLGLRNLGNSCYLNSVLQCLTFTPPLANFCLSFRHSSSCDLAEADKKRDCPFCILEKRIARSLSVDLAQDSPRKMNSSLKTFAEHFRLGRQEDAHEFLRYVIDSCHNACLGLKKLKWRKGGDTSCSGGNEGFSSTVVKEIFGGAIQSQVKCLVCGAESNKVDEIMDLSLDVLHSGSLRDCLQKFFQAENLDGNNKYKCENCKKLVVARKQMFLLQAPNVLVIQLKRFEGIFGGKIDKAIAFDEFLVLASYMCKASKVQDPHPEYKLFGTIVHSGFSPDSGHYYAYVKDATCRWYCCNDSYVKLSNLQEVLSEKVYILFFSRTKQRPAPASTALPSSGVKPKECNGSDVPINRKVDDSRKAAYMDQSVENSVDNLNRSEVNKVPSSPQANKSNSGKNSTQKSLATSNAKIDCSTGNNGDAKASLSAKSEKSNASLGGNGVMEGKAVKAVDGENSQVFPLVHGNGKTKSVPAMSAEVGMREDSHGRNGIKIGRGANWPKLQNGGANCCSDILRSKRKLEDENSCILFAQDIHSQEKLKQFKETLGKEASSILRSCGWTDEVYHSMLSRKKACSLETGNMASHGNELRKSLITNARGNFISKIPESLKETLINRLRSFSQEK